jgi:hypothetical protein
MTIAKFSDGLYSEIFEYGLEEEKEPNTRNDVSDVVKHAYQDDT